MPLDFSSAQISSEPGQMGVSIVLENDNIKPFSANTASLDNYSLSLQVTNISWKIDGRTIPEAQNQRSVEFTSKDVGQTTTIEVTVETFEKLNFSAKRIVTPIYLDIIFEPQTKTPSFYKGRALPSIFSTVNLTALVNGTPDNANNYIYNWSLNDTNITGGALRGKYKVSTEVPAGYQNVIVLSVSTLDGIPVASRSLALSSVEPKLLFYETNTLHGIKNIPIRDSLNLIGNSVSVKAEPYYIDINTYNKPGLLEWKVDGIRSPSSGNNPYEVTLSKQGLNGVSNVNFHVRNLNNFIQGTQGSFKVNF